MPEEDDFALWEQDGFLTRPNLDDEWHREGPSWLPLLVTVAPTTILAFVVWAIWYVFAR